MRLPGATHLVLGFEHRSEAERFLEELRGTAGEVRAGVASGEDAADRVRTLGDSQAAQWWERQAGNLRLSGVHAYLRDQREERALRGSAQDGAEADACEAGGDQEPATGADARAAGRDREVAADGGARLLSIPRSAGKPAGAGRLSLGAGPALAADAAASRPEAPDKLGPVLPAAGRVSAAATLLSPVSKCALCRYPSEVRAV